MSLVDENSGSITAQICHIKAKNSGGPRYDPTQTNEERDAFENLILMCPIHHKIIDDDEESYTVERLQQIKSDHESRTSISNEQGNLEKALETYLRSIIEKGNPQPDLSKTIKEANSSLIRAQKLAKEKMHSERRQQWLYSHDGLVDGINSVNEIFSLIGRRISNNAHIFATLGIELSDKEKYLRNIFNYNFGCQIQLKGFSEANIYDNRLANIHLEIILFKKRPAHQSGLFFTDFVSGLNLAPDLRLDGQVMWKDKENTSQVFSAEGVCEKVFDLLINQVESKIPIDKTSEEYKFNENDDFDDDDAW